MRPDDERPDRQRPPADGCVVLAFPGAEPAPRTARVAASIAESRGSRLVALRIGPSSTSPPTGNGAAADEPAGWTDDFVQVGVEVTTDSDPDRPPVRAVLAAVERHDAGLVVVPGESAGGVGASAVERLLAATPCDLVVVGGGAKDSDVASVLAPVADGPHSGLVLDVAGAIAAATDAWIDVLHVVDPDTTAARRADAQASLASALERLPGGVQADTWLLEAADPADAIVEQSTYYDVTVVGAPQTGKLRRFLYGSTANAVRRGAENTTATVRRWSDGHPIIDRWF